MQEQELVESVPTKPPRDIIRQHGDGAEHCRLSELTVGDVFIPDGGPDDPWEYGQNQYVCLSAPTLEGGVWGCQVESVAKSLG